MKFVRIIQPFWSTLLLALIFASPARAQPAKPDYEPRVGHAGKDVVWVPTPQALVDKMLDMARRTCPWHRVQSGHGRALEAQCRPRGGRR